MKARKIARAAIITLFAAAEIAIYIAFMCFDLSQSASLAIKYAGVIICAAFALYCCKNLRPCDFVLCAAMIFTVVSDWFLLITGENLEIGLTTFIIAQLLHFTRIYLVRKRRPYLSLALRLGFSAAAAIALTGLGYLTLLTALAAVYFCNLLINFADSFALIKINRLYAVFTLGLLLFIGCDICVGLFNFGSALSIKLPTGVIAFAKKGMWAFYLPSQTLIALSGEIK